MTQTKEFFVSYNQADRAWAEWIAWQLEEAGFPTAIQAWDFRPGSNFVIEMDKASREARRTIAVLSPDYLPSHYAQSEWAAAFVQDPTGERGLLLPVLVRPCKLTGLLAAINYIDLVELDEARAGATLLAGIKNTRAKPASAPTFPGNVYSAPTVAFPGNWPLVWDMPYPRNPFFTGRDQLLDALHTRLTTTNVAALSQAISGLGGIGKTQTAIEYAYRYAHNYRSILWANAASAENLLNDYARLANLLKAPYYDIQDQRTAIPAIKQWLAQQKDWLLILDNADDLAMVKRFIPERTGSNGHILLTTRAQATGSIARAVEVAKMDRDEGTLLLLRRAGVIAPDELPEQATQESRNAAEAIVQAMDGLPLALDQAAGYIEEVGCTLADYLQLYQKHRSELLKWKSQLSNDYPATVATTWSLAFQRIEQANPAAAALLQLCAFLAPDAIPEEMLYASAEHVGTVLGPIVGNTLKLNMALELLRRYSLIRRNAETKLLAMHRLVQVVLQEDMSVEMQRLWAERAISTVNRKFSAIASTEEWLLCEKYIPHTYVCAELTDRFEFTQPVVIQLLLSSGDHLQTFARYKEAEHFYQKALLILEKIYGSGHSEAAPTLYKIGQLYYLQDRYEEAKNFYYGALEIYTKSGDEHGSSKEIWYALGQLYHRQGLYQEADTTYRQALSYCAEILNQGEKPDIVLPLYQLATLYEERGEYQNAEEFFNMALSTFKINPSLIIDPVNISIVIDILTKHYQDKGEYESIEALYQELLDTYEKQIGAEHPHIAAILHEFAWYRRWQGAYDEARMMYQRALSIREKMLGADHIKTAETLYYLAELRRQQREDDEAESMLLRALNIYEKVLGGNHISTGATMHELARLYEEQNIYSKAEQFYLRALNIYEKVQGQDHPDIAMVLHEIARVYESQGKYESSIQIEQRALNIYDKKQDTEPQYIISTLRHLAKLSQSQHNHNQAAAYYQRALSIQEQVAGMEKHPDTIKTLQDYAALLRTIGRESEASVLEARIDGQV